MSKTPEEMAREYADDWHKDCDYPEPLLSTARKATQKIFLAGYEAAKDQLADADKVMPEWISVKERLPNENIKVLVLFRKRITAAALTRVEEPFYEAGYFRVWNAHPLSSTDPYEQYPWNEITHWMPLPELPKEGK